MTISANENIAEWINLEAILNLPKGTEHFLSDLHGEFDAFSHILRNGSGSIREKVQTLFSDTYSPKELSDLCFLIYYPEEKIELFKQTRELTKEWWIDTIRDLLMLVRFSSSKYTRSKVRKALPECYAYILEELIYPYDEKTDKLNYYQQIIEKIVELGEAEQFVVHLAYLIQRFVIDHLHVIGDIFDRGPFPNKIIDTLMTYHSLDIQWGNHDIIWLGAVSGSKACLANVIRICARYGNLDLLEDAYGIDLEPLKEFSQVTYHENKHFAPKENPYRKLTTKEKKEAMTIQQAMTIIQEKLEGQLIKRRPEFHMQHRLLLDKITENKLIYVDQKYYELINSCFQTVASNNPYQLTTKEAQLVDYLLKQFQQNKLLRLHMQFLMDHGSMYLSYNNNLLFHGCIPLNEDGSFQTISFAKKKYSGKELLDFFENQLRKAFEQSEKTEDFATDAVWYLWCGETSPLFGKKAMKTFERYFIKEKTTHLEEKNKYYQLRDTRSACEMILRSFNIETAIAHIINGHTPVRYAAGESPVKAEGKLIVIDGGFSRAYQPVTGIGGYTLVYNSFGMQLAAHKPFLSRSQAIEQTEDILSMKQIIDRTNKRMCVKDTTVGWNLRQQIKQIKQQLNH